MEAFRGTLYSVESRSKSPEGDTELVVRQTILFDPPGFTTGIGGAMFARFRHLVRVRKTGDEWRVVGFEPTSIEMGAPAEELAFPLSQPSRSRNVEAHMAGGRRTGTPGDSSGGDIRFDRHRFGFSRRRESCSFVEPGPF
jgi:hypothetical protein